MIYLDTSVALAHLLAEDRYPPDSLWNERLVASRLLEYELWVRLNARRLVPSHGDAARELLRRVDLVEPHPTVLTRLLEPFPKPVRTLDAIHLATADYLRDKGQPVRVASYDERLREAAVSLGFELAPC